MAFAGRRPVDLRHRRLDERVVVDLNGLAAVSVPPTFKFDGIVGSSADRRTGGLPAVPGADLDDQMISLRFVQGQFTRLNGRPASPVVLTVTLFDPSPEAGPLSAVVDTPIAEVEPVNRPPRFQQLLWQTDRRNGSAVTRTSAVDDAASRRKRRWLVIRADSERRVRVDLYAWQETYTQEEARDLVESVAASITPGPALKKYFEGISAVDRRVQALRRATLVAALVQLKRFGITALEPGEVTLGNGSAASLSASGRFLCVARYLHSVPVAAAASDARGRPRFTFVHSSQEFHGQGTINGRPDLQLRMFYWDVATRMWKVAGLQGALFESCASGWDAVSPAILAALDERARHARRKDAHIWDFVFYDLETRPQDADVAQFLARTERYRQALAAGKIIASTSASKASC